LCFVFTGLELFFSFCAGSVVVDFGCGSGALSLPLACVFKEFTFVCVDYKQESLRLLDLRAQAAKLTNLTTWQVCNVPEAVLLHLKF
jgi:precorrin-6B methylase 2